MEILSTGGKVRVDDRNRLPVNQVDGSALAPGSDQFFNFFNNLYLFLNFFNNLYFFNNFYFLLNLNDHSLYYSDRLGLSRLPTSSDEQHRGHNSQQQNQVLLTHLF